MIKAPHTRWPRPRMLLPPVARLVSAPIVAVIQATLEDPGLPDARRLYQEALEAMRTQGDDLIQVGMEALASALAGDEARFHRGYSRLVDSIRALCRGLGWVPTTMSEVLCELPQAVTAFADRYLRGSERGAWVLAGLLTLDCLGADPQAIDQARAARSALWRLIYTPQTTRRGRGARARRGLRRYQWKGVEELSLLERARVWVRANYLGSIKAALVDYYKDTDAPLLSAKGDDRYT